MPRKIFVRESKLERIAESLNELIVNGDPTDGGKETTYFIVFKGRVVFFTESTRKKLMDFLDSIGDQLGEKYYDFIEDISKYYGHFGEYVCHVGYGVPYLISGTIYPNTNKAYVQHNEFYDVSHSNELRQLAKQFPNIEFHYDDKIISQDSAKSKDFPNVRRFYHGTSIENAVGIIKQGLKPQPDQSIYKVKHSKTVFIACSYSDAKSYAYRVTRGKTAWWKYRPCVIEIDPSKIDKDKLVLDYDVYGMYSSSMNDDEYNDVLMNADLHYTTKANLVDSSKDPTKYNKMGYRGIIMPNAILAIHLIKSPFEGGGEDVYSKEELLQLWNEKMHKNESASAEEDEYEIGNDGDSYYHINESYGSRGSGDFSSVNTIEFTPHENAAEEGWDDEDFEPYYEIEAKTVDGDEIFVGNMYVEELVDSFPEIVVQAITDRDSNHMARKVSNNTWRIDDIAFLDTTPSDITDVEEVNAIAKRLSSGGESAYLLTDGEFISFADHNMISSIDGMNPNKFEALGNIRISHSGIELIKEPTSEQIYALKRHIPSMDTPLYVDIGVESSYNYPQTVTSGSYMDPNPNRVVNDILHYFEDGIKLSAHMYESKQVNENFEDEVKPSEVDLSSFKKRDTLVPSLWKDGVLDSRIRLKLLDIADDFWDFVNLKWVEPKGIILTGSICNYNWSHYSDIDLHLVVDFDGVDEKTDFVRDYLDAKKNEWNDEHGDLKIYGYNVELYVQNLGEMPQSSGIYDLEENEWIREPRKEDIKSITLNKFSIKDKAAEIMTIIDGLAMALDNAKDSHEIENVSDDAEYLWAKIKNMRTKGLEKDGESSSANIVYKYMRRQKYLDKLWRIRQMGYDKLMSIDESKQEVIKEYLDKNYNAPLVRYFQWAETASDEDKASDLVQHCYYYLKRYAAEVEGKYPEFIDDIDYDAIYDYDEDEIAKFKDLLKQNNLCAHFISTMDSIVDAEELPTWVHTSYIGIVKNEWCIHFGSDSDSIARDGFTDGTDDLDGLAFTGAGQLKGHEGYNFAYKLSERNVDLSKYGEEAVIFRTSGVEILHYGDQERQVIFWGPYAHDFIPIKQDEYSLEWSVYGKNNQLLYSNTSASKAAYWAVSNYDQYRKQMVVGKSGIMSKRWNSKKGKYTTYGHALENPYPFSENVKKYLHTLKESTINEEVVADGNAEHNPFAEKWKMERKALKDFLCNFGRVMTSKENGKQYKVYYDKSMSELIGYNYCICVQWDPIEQKPKSIIYIRALDKFTNRIFQAQYDDRGRDNMRGTSDDVMQSQYSQA